MVSDDAECDGFFHLWAEGGFVYVYIFWVDVLVGFTGELL